MSFDDENDDNDDSVKPIENDDECQYALWQTKIRKRNICFSQPFLMSMYAKSA